VTRVERLPSVGSNEREDGPLTTQHSDPPRDPTDKGVEVLSDTTDLDALLEAILGDEPAPVETQGRPADAIAAPAVARNAPAALVAMPPPPARVDPDPAFASEVVVADDDAWGFVSEDPQARNEIARDLTPVRDEARPSVAPAAAVPTWRDKLRVSWSRQWLLVAALSAAALITASAITLREEPAPTPTVASSDAAAPVESSPRVANASPVKATASEVEVWAAAREPEQPSRLTSRTPARRPNDAPAARTSTPARPALVETARNAPAASASIASPPVVERITQPIDRDEAPSRPAIPAESEPRRISDSAPPAVASGATAVTAAEPVPTAAAPPRAAVPQRTAARLVTGPAPEYPAALRTARIGGSVEVLLTIDAAGRVVKAQSLTGHPQLRSAAEAAAKRWRYEAARLDNLAVETQTMVRFNFDPSAERRPQE